MPLFAYIGRDGARGPELRPIHRPAHLEALERLHAQGRIRHAGPILDPEGRAIGTVALFEADDLAAAKAFAALDPYVVAGVFEHYDVLETQAVFPPAEG